MNVSESPRVAMKRGSRGSFPERSGMLIAIVSRARALASIVAYAWTPCTYTHIACTRTALIKPVQRSTDRSALFPCLFSRCPRRLSRSRRAGNTWKRAELVLRARLRHWKPIEITFTRHVISLLANDPAETT